MEKIEKASWREKRSIRCFANEVFQDRRAARAWMERKNVFLSAAPSAPWIVMFTSNTLYDSPETHMRTKKGAEQVRRLLGEIKCGVYS